MNTKQPIVADAIYTVPEAAVILSMHAKTLQRKLRTGLIASRRRGGGQYRIKGSELLRFA